MSATLAGTPICDYNTLIDHLAVIVHSIHFAKKTLITEHCSIQLDITYKHN
jgi:hypothetical protein